MHVNALLRPTQAYSSIFRTLCKLCMFTSFLFSQALQYLEPEAYSKPCETLPRDSQNPTIVRTCVILKYAVTATWHNSAIIRTLL